MKAEEVNLVEWQTRYGTEEACATALAKRRWPGAFVCPKCSHDHGYYVTTRRVYQCAHCGHQASVTAGTGEIFGDWDGSRSCAFFGAKCADV